MSFKASSSVFVFVRPHPVSSASCPRSQSPVQHGHCGHARRLSVVGWTGERTDGRKEMIRETRQSPCEVRIVALPTAIWDLVGFCGLLRALVLLLAGSAHDPSPRPRLSSQHCQWLRLSSLFKNERLINASRLFSQYTPCACTQWRC